MTLKKLIDNLESLKSNLLNMTVGIIYYLIFIEEIDTKRQDSCDSRTMSMFAKNGKYLTQSRSYLIHYRIKISFSSRT